MVAKSVGQGGDLGCRQEGRLRFSLSFKIGAAKIPFVGIQGEPRVAVEL